MQSFLLLSIGAVLALIVARLCKNAKVYTGLMFAMLVSFVVGTSMKKAVFTASSAQEKFITVGANPTLSVSPTVVWTVDTADLGIKGQDTFVRDTTVVEYFCIPAINRNDLTHVGPPYTPAEVDDS